MRLATQRFFEDFIGQDVFPVNASGAGAPWTSITVQTAGAPSVLGITANQGAVKLALAATSEAESAALYWGDVLSLVADNLQSVAFRIQMTPLIAANQVAWFGLTSAYNAAPASSTYCCGFRVDGADATLGTIGIDTKDGTTTNSNVLSALLLPTATYLDFVIDFANGLSDVRFFAGDSAHNGHLTRLVPKTTFSCAGLSTHNLQPMFSVSKASGTGIPALFVDYCEILYKRS